MNAFGGRGMCSTLSRLGPRRRGFVGGGIGKSIVSGLEEPATVDEGASDADMSSDRGFVSAVTASPDEGTCVRLVEVGDKGESEDDGGVFSSVGDDLSEG